MTPSLTLRVSVPSGRVQYIFLTGEQDFKSMRGGSAMRILIANDDGIYSPGIAALAEVARSEEHTSELQSL